MFWANRSFAHFLWAKWTIHSHRSFPLSNLSESLTIAHFLWATWAIRSRLLICLEQSEQIAHSGSFYLSEMSEWANERMSDERIPSPAKRLFYKIYWYRCTRTMLEISVKNFVDKLVFKARKVCREISLQSSKLLSKISICIQSSKNLTRYWGTLFENSDCMLCVEYRGVRISTFVNPPYSILNYLDS